MFKTHRISFTLVFILALLVGVPGVFAQTPPDIVSNIQVNPNQGRPTFTWDDDPNATRFRFWTGASDYSSTLYSEWLTKTPELCNGNTCTLHPDINPRGGEYAVFILAGGPGDITATGGDYNGWAGPVRYTITNTPPANITLNIDSDSTNPLFTFQGVANATWYNVWVGTPSPSFNVVFYKWYKAEDIGCGNMGTCTINENLDLPLGSRYITYMRVWGPGGFSQGNLENTPAWIEGPAFTIGGEAAGIEAEILALVNAERARRGISCLAVHPLLTQAAQGHSDDMRDRDYFSHTAPEPAPHGASFADRIRSTGYGLLSGAENIAAGYTNAQTVYEAWFNSEGHARNMFNANYHEIGIALASGGGRYGNYWTMVLGNRTGSNPTPC